MQAFADALLVIPKILAQNSGYDPQETIVKLQSVQHDAGKGLADDAEEGYSAIVIAIAAITFVFVERDDVGVTHVLRHTSFLPAL